MLIDRFSIDLTGMTTEHKEALLKGQAKRQRLLNEDGTIDISDQALILSNFWEWISEIVANDAVDAGDYERDLAATPINIRNA